MNVSRELNTKLRELVRLIIKWNKTINLVSTSSLSDINQRHIKDSLQLLKYLDIENKILDLGSGGGFPGIVLSIAGIKDISLIESDSRKCAFLRVASRLTDNIIHVVNKRVEEVNNITCDVITARGFANIKKIFEYTERFSAKKYLLLKGKSVNSEITEAMEEWSFEYKLHDSITNYDGKIIEIFNISRK